MKKYMCLICGHIYDEAFGDPDTGIAPGNEMGGRAAELDLPGLRRAQGRLRVGRVLTLPDQRETTMRILHTMLRVGDLQRSIALLHATSWA